ncbi:hypothetical protein ACVOMV_20470 [Mesorhizobium atlanticum]
MKISTAAAAITTHELDPAVGDVGPGHQEDEEDRRPQANNQEHGSTQPPERRSASMRCCRSDIGFPFWRRPAPKSTGRPLFQQSEIFHKFAFHSRNRQAGFARHKAFVHGREICLIMKLFASSGLRGQPLAVNIRASSATKQEQGTATA